VTTETPRLARAITVHQAWWEDHDIWDGYALYLDEDTAKDHAADDYERDEYGDPDDRTDEDPPRPLLTWETGFDRWNLLDNGRDTGVRVNAMPVMRQASRREIQQQDALAAAQEAARTQTPA
jgi:hypothetical protein